MQGMLLVHYVNRSVLYTDATRPSIHRLFMPLRTAAAAGASSALDLIGRLSDFMANLQVKSHQIEKVCFGQD